MVNAPLLDSLREWNASPPEVQALADLLVPIFYSDLKRLAPRERVRVSAGETFRTTALVNEAYLKLRTACNFFDDIHFLRAAAQAMRHALVNDAQARLTAKRGGGVVAVALNPDLEVAIQDDESLVALSDALTALSQHAPRLAKVVECRYFGGYNDTETAGALGLSERTVRRDWTLARAWLHRSLRA